jgi:serine/threonine-protein kinase
VVARDAEFAPGWSGLGITQLQYVRHGLGGQLHLLAARRSFDRALEIDPGSIEANLYRVYMLLSRGEKESARHGIEHLLLTADNNYDVHLVAGQTLRLDGMYEEALQQFNRSLQLILPTRRLFITTARASINIRTSWNWRRKSCRRG